MSISIDLGYFPETGYINRNPHDICCNCICKPPEDFTPDEFPAYYSPFMDIGQGLSGTARIKLWETAQRIYRDELMALVQSATKRLDKETIKANVKFLGETDQSLDALAHSFVEVSKISRIKVIPRNRVILNFEFISEFKTMHGKSIKLEVPVILNYKDETYSILNPGLKVGDNV